MKKALIAAALFCAIGSTSQAEEVRLVSYNIENWRNNFEAFRLEKEARTKPEWPQEFIDLIARERREDDEENWEVARVILNPAVLPDVLVLQESAGQSDLEYFNNEFLGGHFETVQVLKSNTERDQHLAVMLRPGFKVIETRDDFRNEPDTNDVNPETDKLFARGPGFVLVETPKGNRIWVGTTHQKSKGGNSVPVTQWRNAEAKRTHEIIKELQAGTEKRVILLGDFNDELGMQEFEIEAGASATDLVAGHDLKVLTKDLANAGYITYHGQRRGMHRSFIDHAVATPELAAHVTEVSIFQDPMADVASDHYPVVVAVELK